MPYPYEVTPLPEDASKVTVKVICAFCSKPQIFIAPAEGVKAYREGAFIQNAFPDLSADQREMFVSGICPTCWDSTFAETEDEF